MASVGCNPLVQTCLQWGEDCESVGGDRKEEPGTKRVRSKTELVLLKRWEWTWEALAGDASLLVVGSAGAVVCVLQEVLVGESPPFPAQNCISKAYWEPSIRPTSHTAILSMPGEKQRSQVP